MRYEYTVMRQVGDNNPEEVSYEPHRDFWDADVEMHNLMHAENEGGYTVRTIEEAERVLEALRKAQDTRYYVAGRKVTDWEELIGPYD